MFFGTTPQIISQFLSTEIESQNPQKVIVPFAGNFVIEQVVGIVNKNIEVHSTDISLYSRLIGFGLTGTPSPNIKLKPEILQEFPRFKDLDDPVDKAVAGIFFAEVGQILKKRKIRYYDGLYKEAVALQDDYFETIKKKVLLVKEKIGKLVFYGTDGCNLVKEAQKGDLVFYDPPVLIGDYEKMFAPLEACFEFDEVPYTVMTEEVKQEHLKYFVDNQIDAMYRVNTLIDAPDGYEEVFRYQYKYHGFYSVFSNRKSTKRFVGRFNPLKEDPKQYPVISLEDEITEKSEIQMVPVSGAIGNHYRLMWVKKAEMSDSGNTYLFLIDGKIVGLLVAVDGLKFGTDLCVIFSDQAAPTSRYKRLSKLILNLICTKEFLTFFNDKSMWEHEGFTTRVFTNNPISMKYRGLFELNKRVEQKEGNYKYSLIYQNRKNIFETYRDGLKAWLKKDGKVKKS